MTRDLLFKPLCKENDLGKPIPDSPHAVSVCLPTWQSVLGYEKKTPAVMEKMKTGYPRFYLHPYVRELFDKTTERLGQDGERAMVFPAEGAAERCLEDVRKRTRRKGRLAEYGKKNLWVALFNEEAEPAALKYWQHSGEIISSRFAAALLEHEMPPSRGDGEWARQVAQRRIGEPAGQDSDDVFLYPSGMAGVFSLHRVVQEMFPKRKCVQLEFPYLDVLKVQEQFGAGVHFLPLDEAGDLSGLEKLLRRGKISAVYCELPSNPLLRTVDMIGLRKLLDRYEVLLVADDTIGTIINIDAYRFADVVTTSLTKYFSGAGDVLAGSVTVNAKSPFANALRDGLTKATKYTLWDGDAIALEQNSRNFEHRVRKINDNGEVIHDFLTSQSAVKEVWYPKDRTPDFYEAIRREGGGYGGLMSMLPKSARSKSKLLYDALEVSKGPSFGANFTLSCPYTLLAHYDELPWAEEHGVSRDLVRLSIGTENPDILRKRFEKAFKALG